MPSASGISDQVSEQLLQICCRNSARAAIPLSLAITLTWLLLSEKVDDRLLQCWALASCLVIMLRVLLLQVFSQSKRLNPKQKRQAATVLTLLLGCTIASVLSFFPYVGSFERAMLTAILLGLCTASHSTNFGYRPLLLSYIGPLLGTLAVLWVINPQSLIHSALAVSVGISLLIVAQTLLMNGKFMFDVFALSIESSTQLEEQSHHLSEALVSAEQAKQEAEASSQSKTRFIAAASHDLRQPVHVLNLFGAALKYADLDKKSADIVNNMTTAVTSLSSQLNALLDISELDSGAIKPKISSIDLSLLTAHLKSDLQKLADDKGIQLINDVTDTLFVRTDPMMLSQVLRNLCGNAIKYTHSGQVTLSTTVENEKVYLSITDTGIGIDNTDTGKVFEEFYQVSNPARDKAHGLGLGLSIVKRLITLLDHQLHLHSQLGKGTRITIEMKACTHSQIATAQTPLEAETSTVALPAGLWVHLVDDEEAVQKSVDACLSTAGCKITVTDNTADTITFLKENQPAVMLIDLRLKDGDSGLNIVNHIKQVYPSLPIALITGESLADGKLAKEYPDLLMLQKPVSNEALLELLDYMVITIEQNRSTPWGKSQSKSTTIV